MKHFTWIEFFPQVRQWNQMGTWGATKTERRGTGSTRRNCQKTTWRGRKAEIWGRGKKTRRGEKEERRRSSKTGRREKMVAGM